jgi:hypothetical protein
LRGGFFSTKYCPFPLTELIIFGQVVAFFAVQGKNAAGFFLAPKKHWNYGRKTANKKHSLLQQASKSLKCQKLFNMTS